MTRIEQLDIAHETEALLAEIIARRGAVAVALAALKAAVRPKRKPRPPPFVHELSAHIRRDIGFPPEPDGPPRLFVNF